MEEINVDCPYCGEPFTALVDWSSGDDAYIQDCEICCRPIEFRLRCGADGRPETVDVVREDD